MNSTNTQLKRSKTTDPSRAPLRQKEPASGEKVIEDKAGEVARVMEERRRERMKTLTRNLEVCDLLDIRNPQSVAEYAPANYKNMGLEEVKHVYPGEFLLNQGEVTEKMRAYLIDWVAELHLKFKLWPETLYVCVGIIDKYLILCQEFKKRDL